jgi:hypothetical protein
MAEKIRIIWPADPDFNELLESGRLVSGADVQTLWRAWNSGQIPDPADGDKIVQPGDRPKGSSKEKLLVNRHDSTV